MKGWLVTVEWQMRGVTSYMKLDTHFTEKDPGRFFVDTREEFPGASALVCAVPVELTEEEAEMFL